MKYHIYLLMSICCLWSCNNNKLKINETKLNHIETLINEYPDSALVLLDSINLTPNEQYEQNRYFLYRIMAKDKSKKDIYMDKEIIDVYKYFEDNNIYKLFCLSAYYSGKVLQANKEYQEAMKYYEIAETSAKQFNNKDFQGEIIYTVARLMIDQFLIDEARTYLTQANELFIETGNYKFEIKSYTLLGFYYVITEKSDSALSYFNRALDLSIKHNDKVEQALTVSNIGVVQDEGGEHENAINTFKKSLEIDSIVCESGKVFLNLAQSYANLGLSDSARYYAHLSLPYINKKDKVNASTKANAYSTLSFIEEGAKQYKQALEYHKMYSKSLTEVLSDIKSSEMSKYKYETIRKENSELSLKQLKTQRFLILSLLFIAILFIVYNRILILKNKQLIRANDEILQLTNQVKDNAIEHISTKESYREHLVHNFKVLKRAASLEYYVQDTGNKQGKTLIKSFNVIAYGKENIDWDILYNTINSVYNGIFDLIKRQYIDLEENEFRICCLIYSKFNSNEIAVITRLSINTVHMKTTSIRKKIGIEKYGNIIDYINNDLNLDDNN